CECRAVNSLGDEEAPGIVQEEPMAAVRDMAFCEVHPRLKRQVVPGDTAIVARRHHGMIPGMRHMSLLSARYLGSHLGPQVAAERWCVYISTACERCAGAAKVALGKRTSACVYYHRADGAQRMRKCRESAGERRGPMPEKLWRQGDVLIQAVAALPEGGVRRRELVLAYGEVTGHSHRVETPDCAELWWMRDNLYLRVLAPTRIVHEEHQPIPLEPGVYRVWQQREYIPRSHRQSNDGVSFRAVRD